MGVPCDLISHARQRQVVAGGARRTCRERVPLARDVNVGVCSKGSTRDLVAVAARQRNGSRDAGQHLPQLMELPYGGAPTCVPSEDGRAQLRGTMTTVRPKESIAPGAAPCNLRRRMVPDAMRHAARPECRRRPVLPCRAHGRRPHDADASCG